MAMIVCKGIAGHERYSELLTKAQALAVAKFLLACTPGDEHELGHGQMDAFQMACQTLVALGCATQTPRGATLLPSPRLPAPIPRWDDTCCVVLATAVQSGKLKLRHSRSKPEDVTGPATATPEANRLLEFLGLSGNGRWTEAAQAVLWRVAPEEVPPSDEAAFLAQVEQAIATMPKEVDAELRAILADHQEPVMRAYLGEPAFFDRWRWGEGWLVDERRGVALELIHDHLARRMWGAVATRLQPTSPFFSSISHQ